MTHTGTDIAAAPEAPVAGPPQPPVPGGRAMPPQPPRPANTLPASNLHELGLLAHQRGDNQTAEDLIRQAIAIAPRTAAFHGSLGVVLLGLRRTQEAAAALRTAIRLHPTDAAAHAYLAAALAALGDYDGAAKAAGATLRLHPGDPAALHMRGVCLEKAGQYEPALAALDAAILADPANYMVRLSRAALLLAMGRTPEASAAFEAAIPLCPGDLRARQGRILSMHYLPNATMQDIGNTARRLAPAAASPSPSPFTGLDRSPDRPLRIGYVSGDFRNHPVGYFLHAVLAARDKAAATVFCYSSTEVEDPMTVRLKQQVDHWRPIFALDDEQAVQAIRADGIDILVDLAGHTNSNRLGVFARRPAPVQAAWLGYFGTTGLASMDVVIADRHVLPPADEPTFTERVIRLPDSYLCYSPPTEAGPVAPLPAGLDRPITFGCFNSRTKLNPDVLALWARVLAAVPGSRLLLKAAQYRDKAIRREITQNFAASGIRRRTDPVRTRHADRRHVRGVRPRRHRPRPVPLRRRRHHGPGAMDGCPGDQPGRPNLARPARRQPAERRRLPRLGGRRPRRLCGPGPAPGNGPPRPDSPPRQPARSRRQFPPMPRRPLRPPPGGSLPGHLANLPAISRVTSTRADADPPVSTLTSRRRP